MTREFTQHVSYRENAPTGDAAVPRGPGHLLEAQMAVASAHHARAHGRPPLYYMFASVSF